MPSNGWRQTTLGEIARKDGYGFVDGRFGSNLPASLYTDEGIPVVRGSNLTLGSQRFIDSEFVFVSQKTANRLRRSICGPNDIVFTKKGTLGQTGIIPLNHRFSTFLISSNQMKLSVDLKVADPLFVYYYVSSPESREKIVRDAEATGVPKTNLAYLRSYPILLPPLREQRAIAHMLGTLDDKIELNRRMNETVEAMAQALFKSWFVDALEDGLPEGWRTVALPEAIEVNPARSLRKGEVAPYVDMQNLPSRGHRALGWINRQFGSGMRFRNGDTLLARITPCLENGKTAFVDWLQDEQVGWGSTEYIVLRPRPPLPPEFGYYLARSEELRSHAIQNMTGTSGRQRVPVECFDQFEIAVPSEPLAKRFGVIARNQMTLIRANDEQNRTLAALRDTLLPKLLSGGLRISAPERKQ